MSPFVRPLILLGAFLPLLSVQEAAPVRPAPQWTAPVLSPASTTTKEAKAAFGAMIGKVFRPREHELASVTAQVDFVRRQLAGGKETDRRGPWTIRWKAPGEIKVTDAAGKPVKGDFTRIVGDLVGHSVAGVVEGQEIRREKSGRILLGPAPAEGADFRPAAIFVPDAKGRLGTQVVLAKGGGTLRRDYVYRTRGEKFLVHRATLRALGPKGELQGEAPTTFTWAEIEGYAFPKEVTTVSGDVVQTVRYSKIKPVRRPAPKKAPAAPKKKPENGTSGG